METLCRFIRGFHSSFRTMFCALAVLVATSHSVIASPVTPFIIGSSPSSPVYEGDNVFLYVNDQGPGVEFWWFLGNQSMIGRTTTAEFELPFVLAGTWQFEAMAVDQLTGATSSHSSPFMLTVLPGPRENTATLNPVPLPNAAVMLVTGLLILSISARSRLAKAPLVCST